jgi:enoyl-CoA hydratase/carnithine racemase
MSPFRASAPLTDDWRHFRFSAADGVGTVVLDRPGKLNALTFEAYADLRDLLTELPHRGDVRVLVLRGSGRAFCSGGDVDEIIGATLAMAPGELLAFTRMTGSVVQLMRETPLPVIAAVHGMAAGAGAALALAADFRVCTPAARFAFLFTKVGLSGGDMGAAYLLPRLVGLGHATRLLMLGDTISAAEADRIGLVSALVEAEEFDQAVDGLARRLASGPAQAYAQTKALLTKEQDMSLAAAVELDAMTQALLMKGQDYAEFHAAFTAGREPVWKGRLPVPRDGYRYRGSAAVVGGPVRLAALGERAGEHLVLLGHAGVAEVGGVPAVRGPGRGAELVQAVVARGVHDLGVPARLAGDDARAERAAGVGPRIAAGGLSGLRLGRPVVRWRVRLDRSGLRRRRGVGHRGRKLRRRGRDRGGQGRDVQHLPDLDDVGPPDLAAVGPVQHRPGVRVPVHAPGDRGQRVAGPDRVRGRAPLVRVGLLDQCQQPRGCGRGRGLRGRGR